MKEIASRIYFIVIIVPMILIISVAIWVMGGFTYDIDGRG